MVKNVCFLDSFLFLCFELRRPTLSLIWSATFSPNDFRYTKFRGRRFRKTSNTAKVSRGCLSPRVAHPRRRASQGFLVLKFVSIYPNLARPNGRVRDPHFLEWDKVGSGYEISRIMMWDPGCKYQFSIYKIIKLNDAYLFAPFGIRQ